LQEEEEVIPGPPQAVIPDHNLCQHRSSGGKLAYVIFGDQTTGIYYNWYDFSPCSVHIETFNLLRKSCEYKLNSFSHAGIWKPRYFGYETYDEAKVAWKFYTETRIVPYSPLSGGVSATPVPSAQHIMQPTTPKRNRHQNVEFEGH
jgi:hypothetical protein